MRADRVVPVVKEAIKLRPKAIWLQLGIRDDEARALTAASGIIFVMDKCIKQEHTRLLSFS
jgi:predicted CoA-binding protein